jgi:hypothetical protein
VIRSSQASTCCRTWAGKAFDSMARRCRLPDSLSSDFVTLTEKVLSISVSAPGSGSSLRSSLTVAKMGSIAAGDTTLRNQKSSSIDALRARWSLRHVYVRPPAATQRPNTASTRATTSGPLDCWATGGHPGTATGTALATADAGAPMEAAELALAATAPEASRSRNADASALRTQLSDDVTAGSACGLGGPVRHERRARSPGPSERGNETFA